MFACSTNKSEALCLAAAHGLGWRLERKDREDICSEEPLSYLPFISLIDCLSYKGLFTTKGCNKFIKVNFTTFFDYLCSFFNEFLDNF